MTTKDEALRIALDALEMLQSKLSGNVNGADEHCFTIGLKNHVSHGQMVRVSEAITAIKQAQPAWQPIETAPKDSQYRLFWRDGMVHQACWLGEGKGFGGDGWRFDFEENIKRGFNRQPTHWMPLPAPPEAA